MDSHLSHKPLATDTVVFDRYRVLAQIGKGGMGYVYKVLDIQDGSIKALKTLIVNPEKEEKSITRFKKEFSSMISLDHSCIVRAYDLHEDASGLFGFTMECVEGKDLDSLIYSESMALEISQKMKIIGQIAEGLQYAHGKKLIHRDLKPANILVTDYNTPDPKAKIVDFGLAQKEHDEEDLSVSSKQVGTAYYMSPEQHRGEDLDALSDIYSFGILVFEMMTGKRPFDGSTPFKLFLSHVWDGIPNVREINPDIPKWIATMIEICCEKEKRHRYQSMDEVSKMVSAKAKKPTRSLLRLFQSKSS